MEGCPYCGIRQAHTDEGTYGCEYCSVPPHEWDGEKLVFKEATDVDMGMGVSRE